MSEKWCYIKKSGENKKDDTNWDREGGSGWEKVREKWRDQGMEVANYCHL